MTEVMFELPRLADTAQRPLGAYLGEMVAARFAETGSPEPDPRREELIYVNQHGNVYTDPNTGEPVPFVVAQQALRDEKLVVVPEDQS